MPLSHETLRDTYISSIQLKDTTRPGKDSLHKLYRLSARKQRGFYVFWKFSCRLTAVVKLTSSDEKKGESDQSTLVSQITIFLFYQTICKILVLQSQRC